MTAQPLRIDELPFFGHIVERISVRRGSLLATGKQHVTLEEDARDLSPRQVGILLNATVTCPACGSRIHPFRTRRGRRAERIPENVGRVFLSVSCRYEDSPGCARGRAASQEIARLVQVIEERQTQRRGSPAPAAQAADLERAEQPKEPQQLELRGLP